VTKQERELLEMAYNGILQIDKDGLIWKCKKKHKEWDGYKDCRPRLQGHDHHGYVRIAIRDENGDNLKAFVHRLVFMYFYGNIPKGLQINHKDGNGHNNCLGNLELMTSSQQMIHAVNVLGRKVGNRTRGKQRKGVHSKLSADDREAIFYLADIGMSQRKIARKFDVTQTRISQIVREA